MYSQNCLWIDTTAGRSGSLRKGGILKMPRMEVRLPTRSGAGRLSWKEIIEKPTWFDRLLGRRIKTVSYSYSGRYNLGDDAVSTIPMPGRVKAQIEHLLSGNIKKDDAAASVFRLYGVEDLQCVLAVLSPDGWFLLDAW